MNTRKGGGCCRFCPWRGAIAVCGIRVACLYSLPYRVTVRRTAAPVLPCLLCTFRYNHASELGGSQRVSVCSSSPSFSGLMRFLVVSFVFVQACLPAFALGLGSTTARHLINDRPRPFPSPLPFPPPLLLSPSPGDCTHLFPKHTEPHHTGRHD